MLAALLSVPAAPASAAITPAAGVHIQVSHTNLCMNVQGGGTANSAKIVQ
ncbi:hypothetical protein [Plantactinospora sp. B24E8]